MHTYTFNEFILRTSDALKYSYYPQDIARCYRNLGYYYVEENDFKTALALYVYSMEFEASPLAYTEINYIKSRSKLELTLNECVEIIEGKNIQLGVNPFILDCLDELIYEYEKNNLPNQLRYFLELKFDITNDENILEKINKIK